MARARRGRAIAIAAGVAAVAVFGAAAWSLRGLAIEAWSIPDLRSEDKAKAARAVDRIARYGSARSIPQLLRAIEADGNGDPEEETDLTNALRACRERAGPRALPALESYLELHEESDKCSIWAAKKALAMDPACEPARRSLLRALSRGGSEESNEAFGLLEACGVDTVPVLIGELQRPGGDRVWAADLIEDIGPQAQSAVPALLPVLDDADPWARLEAAEALVEIGGGPRDKVLARLVEGVEGGRLVGGRAASFLHQLGVPEPEVHAVLLEGWKRSKMTGLEWNNCLSSGDLGCPHLVPGSCCGHCGEAMLPVLEAALRGDEGWLCAHAAMRLAAMGKAELARERLPRLLEELRLPQPAAVLAVAAILPPREAARALREAYLSMEDEERRRTIMEEICRTPTIAEESLPFLARFRR